MVSAFKCGPIGDVDKFDILVNKLPVVECNGFGAIVGVEDGPSALRSRGYNSFGTPLGRIKEIGRVGFTGKNFNRGETVKETGYFVVGPGVVYPRIFGIAHSRGRAGRGRSNCLVVQKMPTQGVLTE